jgi:hypothetical protein
MTRTAFDRDPLFRGEFPHRSTYNCAANVLLIAGTIAALNASGEAVEGVDDNNAFRCVGVFASSFDNRTTAPGGGAAGAEVAEVLHGVFGFAFTGATPIPGQTVFCVDNQTVSVDNDSGTRGFAGRVTCVEGTVVYVFMGPAVDVAADTTALVTSATSAYAFLPIPLTTFVDADGDPLAKFVDAASPTFGFNLADSEAFGLRWNNHATPGTALTQVGLPYDLDDTAAAYVECVCSKSGATVGDATTLTLTAFILAVGDIHDSDANAGGVTNALVGNATAKTTALLSRTIAAADIPAGARTMTLTITPTAGLLGTDDLIIHSVGLRYKRKQLTA